MSHQRVLFSNHPAFKEVVCILQAVATAMSQSGIRYCSQGSLVGRAVIELPALGAFIKSPVMSCITPGTCACTASCFSSSIMPCPRSVIAGNL